VIVDMVGWFTVFNVTFNNISVISWQQLKTLAVISTDCIGSYKSNYHMITTMGASDCWYWWNWWASLFKLSFHNI